MSTQTLQHDIAIIGAGTMGRTIATGMINAGILTADRLRLSDHSHDKAVQLAAALGAVAADGNVRASRGAGLVMLCVKPKDVAGTLAELRAGGAIGASTLLVSIAAGVSIAALEAGAGDGIAVIRAMPNTPCLVGCGMTVLTTGRHATPEQLAMTHAIFSTLGRSLTLDEKHMDVVTGLSGSGPAFVYVMLEALADGGVMCGLPRATATELVAQVALGAATMILETERHPSALKDDVTTPGGCTIAGLLALEDGKIRSVLARAVETATHTASRLGQSH